MAKNIVKYQSIYLFILILSIIGFTTGVFYYKVQTNEIKQEIKDSINIEEDLSSPTNNFFKRIKDSMIILVNSIFILPQLSNISKIFTSPFEIGFTFSFLTSFNIKFSIIYTIIYHIIPLIITLILIRIGITISLNIIKLIIEKDRKTLKKLKNIIIKYLLITSFLLIYEIIISIFSSNINSYLMTIIKL